VLKALTLDAAMARPASAKDENFMVDGCVLVGGLK
jgi:hypothetical protein